MALPLYVVTVLVLAGVLALEVGISSAITEVAAGVVLGLFFDVSGLGWLDFLAHFGLLGLMFMAGFEVDLELARRTWRPSLVIGLASFLVPFAGVTLASLWVFDLEAPAALLLGVGLSTTSLALVYQYLRERDLLGAETGQVVLGAATVVDVVSMVALAVLLGHLGWRSLAVLAGVVAAFSVLPRVMVWTLRRYRKSAVEFELRFLLLVLVSLAFLAERGGIHAAIVSFVAGLVLARLVQDHHAVEDKLKGVVFSFFAPVFFLRAGTQLDLRGLDVPTLLLTTVLFVVAVGLKYVATAAVGHWMIPTLGHFVGGLFNYRLTFGIITATVGLEAGVLGPRLFSTILLVVLISAAVPMIMLRDLPSELEP